VTDGRTDRQTDGIAMAYTRYSIYAVTRKNYMYTSVGHLVDFISYQFQSAEYATHQDHVQQHL